MFLDNACAEAALELTSARSRIKAKYSGPRADIELFFPPKWQLASSGIVRISGAISGAREGSWATVVSPKSFKVAREELAVADLFA